MFLGKACDVLCGLLHSEIDQIHLSIEAQCGTPVYLWVTATYNYDVLSRVYISINDILSKVKYSADSSKEFSSETAKTILSL